MTRLVNAFRQSFYMRQLAVEHLSDIVETIRIATSVLSPLTIPLNNITDFFLFLLFSGISVPTARLSIHHLLVHL